MSSNLYVCPICGGSLSYWTEAVHEKRCKINPTTGKLQKTIKTVPINTSGSGNEGLICNDEQCGWCYNTIFCDGSKGNDISEIFKNVNFLDNKI